MSAFDFHSEISLLSPSSQMEVREFVTFLLATHAIVKSPKPATKRTFGLVKGGFYMAPDFDAPLDDFKSYM